MIDARYVLVITPDAVAAPTALFFARLACLQRDAVRIAQYRRDRVAGLLGRACAGVAVLCADSPDSWLQGLLRAVDGEQAAGLRERLAAYREREFNGVSNLAVWRDLLTRHRRPALLTAALRTTVVAAWVVASLPRRQLPLRRLPRS